MHRKAQRLGLLSSFGSLRHWGHAQLCFTQIGDVVLETPGVCWMGELSVVLPLDSFSPRSAILIHDFSYKLNLFL